MSAIFMETEIRAYFKAHKAELVGHHTFICDDGAAYHFYRGKIHGKSGDKSAPRALIVVESDGTVRPIQELGSYARKKLRVCLKKHR